MTTPRHDMMNGAAARDGTTARSDTPGRPGGRHRREPIAVVWDDHLRRPSAFVRQGRRHRIARVLERWTVATGWWSEDVHVDRSYIRVEADGRLFDLCYDRLTKTWSLERAL